MDDRIKRLLGDGPYPFNINKIGESNVDAFVGQGMIILSSKGSINMSKGCHSHDSYEFLLPLTDMPYTGVEKKVITSEKYKFLPINSEQSHGPIRDIFDWKLMSFQIDKKTFNDISYSYCNKNDITFENESIKVGIEIFGPLTMFKEETRNTQAGSDFILQNLINLITVNILRQFKSNIPKLIKDYNYCERDNINRAIAYLREEYNSTFSLDDVASIANLSPYHFIRTFKAMTGKTPYDYLLDVKIEKSKELLKLKNYSITDICFRCGFNNLEHFSSVFKRKVGIVPSQYRKLQQ